jgi:hypothetical protein
MGALVSVIAICLVLFVAARLAFRFHFPPETLIERLCRVERSSVWLPSALRS